MARRARSTELTADGAAAGISGDTLTLWREEAAQRITFQGGPALCLPVCLRGLGEEAGEGAADGCGLRVRLQWSLEGNSKFEMLTPD